MSKRELTERVRALAAEAKAAGHLEAALTLFTLAGSLAGNSERTLSDVCARHAEADLKRLTASLN